MNYSTLFTLTLTLNLQVFANGDLYKGQERRGEGRSKPSVTYNALAAKPHIYYSGPVKDMLDELRRLRSNLDTTTNTTVNGVIHPFPRGIEASELKNLEAAINKIDPKSAEKHPELVKLIKEQFEEIKKNVNSPTDSSGGRFLKGSANYKAIDKLSTALKEAQVGTLEGDIITVQHESRKVQFKVVNNDLYFLDKDGKLVGKASETYLMTMADYNVNGKYVFRDLLNKLKKAGSLAGGVSAAVVLGAVVNAASVGEAQAAEQGSSSSQSPKSVAQPIQRSQAAGSSK